MFWWILLALVVVFIAVLLVRAARFKPKVNGRAAAAPCEVDAAAAVEHLAQMVRVPTVSSYRLEEFDEETLTTIYKFFENSLNVSETSRQLYIHRNTLVYRLDKLQKSTGLDLRVFEDAITFKIALMVVKYMKYMENQDY